MPDRTARFTIGTRTARAALLLVALTFGCGRRTPAPGGHAYDQEGRRVEGVTAPKHPPNLIVIVIDALRADALPAVEETAGGEGHMPFLASLAERGVRFTSATAAAPWTLPSMTSLLTGLLPSEHGQYQVLADWNLPEAITTFAEILSNGYGYDTAAFVNGTWFQRSGDSLLQGFRHKRTTFSFPDTAGAVARWSRTRDRSKPFFLLLHTYEAHDPYGEKNHPWPNGSIHPVERHPELFRDDASPADLFRACSLDAEESYALTLARGGPALGEVLQRYKYSGYGKDPKPELATELRTAYFDGVTWVDGQLERAYESLEKQGLLENTLVVVTADHGEAFGEHGNLAHGLFLYDEVVRVPLVMVGPPPFQGGHVVRAEVGLVDVLPTYFAWAGLAPLEGIQGRSAMSVLDGSTWCRPVISEERLTQVNTGEDVDAVRLSARTARWKYIATFDLATGQVREEAYDLWFDPGEKEDLGKGTGRIPPDQVFDPCLCAAMQALRDRIWHDASNEEGEVYTTPYGAAAPRANGLAPPPCKGEQ